MLDKRYRIQDAAITLFKEQGVESTSVNEIVKRANVAKGTFYVYYKDKHALISQILTKQHGSLINDILNVSFHKAKRDATCWKKAFVEELITYHRNHSLLLKTIQKNLSYIFDTEEHRMRVFAQIDRLNEFLALWKRVGEEDNDTLNRFMLVMEIVNVACYNAISFHHPDNIERILPEIQRAVYYIMESEVALYDL